MNFINTWYFKKMMAVHDVYLPTVYVCIQRVKYGTIVFDLL